jgi:glycosyltransferase involved in cell wall biosynthesis
MTTFLQSPLVSICIPCFNEPIGLERCLNSILKQSFKNYEIIITDDSTHDGVYQVYCDFKNHFNEAIIYHKNDRPLGSPQNWNRAVASANAAFIKIMHHDDWFINNDSLEKFVLALEQIPTAAFVFSHTTNFDIASATIGYVNRPDSAALYALHENPFCLFSENIIGSPSAVLFRKENCPSFNPALKWFVDCCFYIDLLRATSNNCVCIASEEVYIGISNSQITKMCEHNPAIVFYELFFCFHYFKINFSSNKLLIKTVINYIIRFNIHSVQHFEQVSSVKANRKIRLILFLNSYVPKRILTIPAFVNFQTILIFHLLSD